MPINGDEARSYLIQTLMDGRLTGSEKHAVAEWLSSHADADQDRGVVRHLAFDIARENLIDPHSRQTIDWLEALLKILAPIESRVEEPASKATSAAEVLFSPGEAILNHLIDRFDSTRRTVDICVFTITDDRISKSILAAHRRGVRIRIISDGDKAHDLGSDLFQFRNEGVHVKLDDHRGTPTALTGGHMHHKFAIFDGTHLVNGSYNWTRGAVTLNHENLVDTADPKLVKAFQKEFDRIWNRL